jgi:hypothetical protein
LGIKVAMGGWSVAKGDVGGWGWSWRTYLATPTRLVERVVVMPNESHSVVANEGAHLQEIRRTLLSFATSPPAYPHDPERMWAVAVAVAVIVAILIVIVIVVAIVSVIVIANVNGSLVHHHHLQ